MTTKQIPSCHAYNYCKAIATPWVSLWHLAMLDALVSHEINKPKTPWNLCWVHWFVQRLVVVPIVSYKPLKLRNSWLILTTCFYVVLALRGAPLCQQSLERYAELGIEVGHAIIQASLTMCLSVVHNSTCYCLKTISIPVFFFNV